MVRYSFVLHEVSDAPHLCQNKHHLGYKLLLYVSRGATPRCIGKLASAHFVPDQGWTTRINVSRFSRYVRWGATFSSSSTSGFAILFLRSLIQLIGRSKAIFFSKPKPKFRGKGSIFSRTPFSLSSPLLRFRKFYTRDFQRPGPRSLISPKY